MIFVDSAPERSGGGERRARFLSPIVVAQANRLAQRYMHIAQVYHAACQTIHRHFSEQGWRIYYLYIGYSRQTVF